MARKLNRRTRKKTNTPIVEYWEKKNQPSEK